MKVWAVVFGCNYLFAFAPSKKEAAKLRRSMRGQFDDANLEEYIEVSFGKGRIERVDIPTTHRGLIDFLNGITCDGYPVNMPRYSRGKNPGFL